MITKTFGMAKEIRSMRAKSLRVNKSFRDHWPELGGFIPRTHHELFRASRETPG
jgi:hypothetical protein